MTIFIVRRTVSAARTFFLITLISFVVIQLPPGDVVSNWVRQQEASTGQPLPPVTIENLRRTYGFDQPLIIQYFKWIDGFPNGDFGFSIEYSNAPVADILAQRTGLTIFLGVATLFVSWGLAIPFGISAFTHKNSRWDYPLSTLSFIGISTPNFLIAVIYLFIAVFVLKTDYSGGLYSQEFKDAPRSWARLLDFAKHLPIPLAILGLGGMAGTVLMILAFTLPLGNLIADIALAWSDPRIQYE